MSPELRQLNESQLPVETKRALSIAHEIASEQNSNLGLEELYIGVFDVMGKVFAASLAQRNGIDPDQFNKNLKLAMDADTQDTLKFDASAKPRLTPLTMNAIRYGINHAVSQKRQEILVSDLLLGIAQVAEEAKKQKKIYDFTTLIPLGKLRLA